MKEKPIPCSWDMLGPSRISHMTKCEKKEAAVQLKACIPSKIQNEFISATSLIKIDFRSEVNSDLSSHFAPGISAFGFD